MAQRNHPAPPAPPPPRLYADKFGVLVPHHTRTRKRLLTTAGRFWIAYLAAWLLISVIWLVLR